ncbi:MAG: LacI family DNA-binding transcriptional regulator [Candidatus Devosia phytovorans]|uniref:LacI family DNA-binding transcriptional regulator n=1 Tax=Candidatus Devosia phytovorans TaxID=3121372 RepID=A0AAJ6B1E9_9HYPH|nr:LacI family DNA-binding transcriptional regulator [Devosia sp.]WEK04388.1 MAG: LacI family DNA-binding transcriptional regulator [Devosia sp.]
MKSRATLTDIAELAQVGVATVDRVLNGRAPVRKDTADRVLKAAEELNYYAVPLMRQRAMPQLTNLRLGIILQKRADPLYQNIAAALRQAFDLHPDVGGKLDIAFVDDISAQSLATKILEIGARCDALACVAIDHPLIVSAFERLHALGRPVFTLLSEVTASSVTGYVGLDSRKLGRTGAYLVSSMAAPKGRIATLVGSHRYRGQELSEIGFRSYFRDTESEDRLLETIVNLDDPDVAGEVTKSLLDRHANLAAIYDAGGGRDGIIRAIREHPSGQRPMVVCNDLTPSTRLALIDGIITCTLCLPVQTFGRVVVDEMIASVTGSRPVNPASTLPFDIVFAENLPT